MQLDVELVNDDGRALEYNYRYELFCALQRAYSHLHSSNDDGDVDYRGALKLFTFSPLNSSPYPENVKLPDGRPGLLFSGRVWMRIASICPRFLCNLGDALLSAHQILIRGVCFRINAIKLVPTPDFVEKMCYKPFGQSGAFACRYIRGPRVFYQLPDNRISGIPDCVDLLVANIRYKIQIINKLCPGQFPGAEEESIQAEITPVSSEIPFRTTMVRLKTECAKGFRAPVVVTAPVAIHQLIWSSGLGNQNSVGFGLVRIGRENETEWLTDLAASVSGGNGQKSPAEDLPSFD